MKKFVILSLFALSLAPAAQAMGRPSKPVSCGDTHTVGRDAGRSEDSYTCMDPKLQLAPATDAAKDAEAQALGGLGKFDRECQAAGGNVVAHDSVVSMNPHIERQSSCIDPYSPYWYPAPACHHMTFCQIDAHVEVTHDCACAQ